VKPVHFLNSTPISCADPLVELIQNEWIVANRLIEVTPLTHAAKFIAVRPFELDSKPI